MAYRNYSTAAGFIVDSTAGNGDFTTIQAAITAATTAAAVSGTNKTIFIRPGTYTENLTLAAGINLCAYTGDAFTPNVTIVGKCTFTAAGTVTISGIRLVTNSDYFLSVTGSVASVVNLFNCNFTVSNSTGIQFTSSSASAKVFIKDCLGNITTTGITLWTHSSSGVLEMLNTEIANTGLSTTAANASAGQIVLRYSRVDFPMSTSGTAILQLIKSSIITTVVNTKALDHASTASNCTVEHSTLDSGTATTISVGAGATLPMKNSIVGTTNTTAAIDGAGTVNYGDITFADKFNITTTTQGIQVTKNGVELSSLQPLVSAYKSSDTANATGDATQVQVVFDTESTDQNANYNNATGVFTAPYTGNYLFCGSVGLTSIGTSSSCNVQLNATVGNWRGMSCSPAAIQSAGTQANFLYTAIIPMTVGDTCFVQITASGSTKTITLQGNTLKTTHVNIFLLS